MGNDEKRKQLDKQSHDLEGYRIQQEFNRSLEREISNDLNRSFTGEEDISYDGVHFEIPEGVIDRALESVGIMTPEPEVDSVEDSQLLGAIGKLRARIIRGRR